MNRFFKVLFTLILSISATTSFADNTVNANTAAEIKTYTLLNLNTVSSNHSGCESIYQSLKKLQQHSLSFQITHSSNPENYNLNDTAGQIQVHRYTVLNQSIHGKEITRIGTGNFKLDQHDIQYVVVIFGDAAQPNFQYLYPVILSADSGHCAYTAVLKPDFKTREHFKENIEDGDVNSKKDIAD